MPTPRVKGHVLSLPLLHASRSISSVADAAEIAGTAGFTATAGPYCLFCGNCVVGLPDVTSVSLPYGVAPASEPAESATTVASTPSVSVLVISPSPLLADWPA